MLAVALGIYLPLKLSAAIFVGGVLSLLVKRHMGEEDEPSPRGVLFAAGLVTGEAMMGIMLAVPIAMAAWWPGVSADPFALFIAPPFGGWPGLAMMILVGGFLYRVSVIPRKRAGSSSSEHCAREE